VSQPSPARDPRTMPAPATTHEPSRTSNDPRDPAHAWTRAEVAAVYRTPVLELILRAAAVHRRHHTPGEVQVCVLLSVKTGGCPEDCGYCPQAARYHTHVSPQGLMDVSDVLAAARRARDAGATRFCMGAAWREVRDG